MTRAWSTALVVLLGLVGAAGAQEKKDEAPKEELPFKDKIAWEVKAFEEDPDSFTLVKRTLDKEKNQVVWVLECNSVAAAQRMNTNGEFTATGYFALVQDADGVTVGRIKFASEPASNLRKGDRVRATLKLPDAELQKKAEKIVIKFHE